MSSELRNALPVQTIAIIGVGLIGGSFAASIKAKYANRFHVIGVDKSIAELEMAQTLGYIDHIETSISKAVEKADLIMLATPVLSMSSLFQDIAPYLSSDKIVTDVGSVKGDVVAAAEQALGEHFNRYVPGHPIAGREKSGVMASSENLFARHKIVLTPVSQTDSACVDVVSQIWKSLGAQVYIMDVDSHDRVLSITSHLPHLLSYAMMDFLANSVDSENAFKLTAGGFYDFTRTASSDAQMWTDICQMNKQHLLEHIAQFSARLDEFANMIKAQDGDELKQAFNLAKSARERIKEQRQPLEDNVS